MPSLLDETDDDRLIDEVWKRLIARWGAMTEASRLPPIARNVIVTYSAGGIIDNGGFRYLFEHRFVGDEDFVYTAAAFRAIGSRGADSVAGALALFSNNSPPADIQERLAIYLAVPDEIRERIDNSFYKSADWQGKLAAYVRSHREELAALI